MAGSSSRRYTSLPRIGIVPAAISPAPPRTCRSDRSYSYVSPVSIEYQHLIPLPRAEHGQRKKKQQTFNCSLCSSATANTSGTYSPNPRSVSAFSICSHAIVFLASFSLISLASEEIRVMNSTQHSIRRSRASLAKVCPDEGGRISLMIFWTVAAAAEAC